jgi:serine/threonine-protein kinase
VIPDRLAAALADRYRLERPLGQGGMATVYLAEDLKHDRKVAVKVLRPELAAVLGAERFGVEIKTTAALQHPHILPLFDSGSADGFLYYVMPYVVGETLRARLDRDKQLGIEEAVRITREVADALDYAHRHGVIHRDIKPENILLHDGRPMVADFGIALAVSAAGGRMTETGLSLGTPQYMSPEQAMGEREITARSDVFALGTVLYEMLVGEPPFTGPTTQAIVAKVMTGEPESLAGQRRTIPPNVEGAVLTALQKLPADRFASAAEFAAALGNPGFGAGRVRAAAGPVQGRPVQARSPRLAQRFAWPIALVAAILAVWGWLRPGPAPPSPPIYRFDVLLPDGARWVGDILSPPALSPDGTLLAYSGEDTAGHRWLYLRAMDRHEVAPVAGSENAANPFFSPEGGWIGYTRGTQIVRTPVAGGPTETICDGGDIVRPTWLESGTIVFANRTTLQQCSMEGQVRTLLSGGPGETFNWAHGLPGGRDVLFSIQRGDTSRLAVVDLESKTQRSLGIVGSNPRYVATGHLVYVNPEGQVQAVKFDPRSMMATGPATTVEAGILIEFGGATMALSRTGTIVVPVSQSTDRLLELVDRSGRAERLFPRPGEFADPRFSPDGQRVAVTVGKDAWWLTLGQGGLTRLTLDGSASRPFWSRDGRHVAYVSQVGSRNELRRIAIDGSAAPESLLTLPTGGIWEGLYTPDGRSILARIAGGRGRRDLLLAPLASAGPPVPLLESAADELTPAFSPDGRWLA